MIDNLSEDLISELTINGWNAKKIVTIGIPSIIYIIEAKKGGRVIVIYPLSGINRKYIQLDRDIYIDLKKYKKKRNIPVYIAVKFSSTWTFKEISHIENCIIYRSDLGEFLE